MRVLHVTADWKWTGPAEPMLHAVVGLRARGHEVDLLCPEPPPGHGDGLAPRARERGVEPVAELARARGYRPLRDRGEVAALRALAAERGYDVVHAHHTRDLVLARRALPDPQRRLVYSWHRAAPVPATPWSRWLLSPRGLAGLTVLTEAGARGAARALRRAPASILVTPGCVDVARFAPRPRAAPLQDSLGIKPGERVAGVVARLQPHRRFDLLLEAYARARAAAPGLRLLVVGRGTRARQVLDAPVAALGLERAVIRAGYRREDYVDVLALLDALVFLVPGSDGSCRAVLEGMAMGIPTIASRRGVLPDLVRDGETGALVEETPDALAAALVDVACDADTWSARGRAARDHALERHGVDRHAERLERLYLALPGAPD